MSSQIIYPIQNDWTVFIFCFGMPLENFLPHSFLFSQITGLPLPSHPPWPWMWQPNGGIIVPCNYILFCDPKDHLLIYQILCAAMVFAPGSYVTIEP